MPDIFDRDSFKKWLYNQPREVAVALSARAILRVFPLIATDEYPAQSEVVTQLAFHFLRASFTSLTTIVHHAARETAEPDISFAQGTAKALTKAALTVSNATHTAGYAAYAALAADSGAKAAQELGITAQYWAALMDDISHIEQNDGPVAVVELPLWSKGNPPSEMVIRHSSFEKYLTEDTRDWRFWLGWYADCLSGTKKDWAQMKDIVGIAAEDWAKGADFINPVLSGLVSADEAYATIDEPADPDVLRISLARVDDILDDVLAGKSGIEERSLECVILRRLQTKYATDAQRVEMDLSLVHRSLTRQLETGELPDLPEIYALAEICGTGALDLRAANPELAKTRTARKKQAAKERPALKLIKGGHGTNVVPHKAVENTVKKMTATRSNESVPLPEGAAAITANPPKREPEPAKVTPKPTGLLGRLGISAFNRQQDAVGE